MSENRGGDVLARGERSAQFKGAGANLTEFEYDLTMRTDEVGKKYGLSQLEVERYQERRANGEKLDLKPAGEALADLVPALESRWKAKAVPAKPKKFVEKTYTHPNPLLDRILVKRVPEDPEKYEILEDGSLLDKKTGFTIPYAYRQHNNIGIVLAAGPFVVLGGLRIPMYEVVRVGDRVTFGDYNSEVFKMPEDRIVAMCDAVQMNYEADPEGLRVVRVQDVRVVERPISIEPVIELTFWQKLLSMFAWWSK